MLRYVGVKGGRSAAGPAPERLLEAVFPPMLATPAAALPGDAARFVAEPKYDGFRALVALASGRVAMWSRNRLDLARRFPAVAAPLGRIAAGDAVLDGELVAFDARGVPRFERLHDAGAGTALVAFDLLRLDGEDLRGRPIEARRALLERLLDAAPAPVRRMVRLMERLDPAGGDVLETARRRGLEGLVLKRRGSPYVAGRSTAWLKVKLIRTEEVAIVGFLPLRGAPAAAGALLVAVAAPDGLRFAGRVGTGFSARDRVALRDALAADAVPSAPVSGAPALRDAVWVRPRHVAEVGFAEWTADGMLRHPRFRRLRPDRTPAECVREAPEPGGAPVVLTHAARVLYPRDGVTKRDVADYYARVAAPMLRALAGRPLALEHFTAGIDRPSWFEQTVRRPPPWMTLAEVPSRAAGSPPARRLVADRPEALAWLAQHCVLTVHMWSARLGGLATPDWVVFDLDPGEGHGFTLVVEAALVLRGLFERLGLASVPKTSGRRGLHVLVPIAPGHSHEAARRFATGIGAAVAAALPGVTVERAPARRRGRLYLDCLQNGPGKTIVAPYSPRALDGAPVSAPLAWTEVTRRLDPSRFTIRTMPRRIERTGDLFAPALSSRARLPDL
jgi:bifunctional non-homologous end joining protein LigD